MSTRYAIAKDVAENGVFDAKGRPKKLEGALLDGMTANLLVTIYEALSDTNKAKFDTIPLTKLVNFAWSNAEIKN
jgi:hypothetical protein